MNSAEKSNSRNENFPFLTSARPELTSARPDLELATATTGQFCIDSTIIPHCQIRQHMLFSIEGLEPVPPTSEPLQAQDPWIGVV